MILFLFFYIETLRSTYCDWDKDGVIYNRDTNQTCVWSAGLMVESDTLLIEKGCPHSLTLVNVMMTTYIGKESLPDLVKLKVVKDKPWKNQFFYYFYKTKPDLDVVLFGVGFGPTNTQSLRIIIEMGTASFTLSNMEDDVKHIQYGVYYPSLYTTEPPSITFKGKINILHTSPHYETNGCKYIFTTFDNLQEYQSENVYISDCGFIKKVYVCTGVANVELPCVCNIKESDQFNVKQCSTSLNYEIMNDSYATVEVFLNLGTTYIKAVHRDWTSFSVFSSPVHILRIEKVFSKVFTFHSTVTHFGLKETLSFSSKGCANDSLLITEQSSINGYIVNVQSTFATTDMFINNLKTAFILIPGSHLFYFSSSEKRVISATPFGNCSCLCNGYSIKLLLFDLKTTKSRH
ncbi:hypothetical protein EIN_034160 [Entamoeba invadens IP1]|uniref:Uncharacterized protein n=1 Tax=Entamoeba invadens IP1 TaxID=370355 RepID=A0A0A1TYE2_ENTIV|nr:hypothetical protein EIN_034160 [Entamoeba invadens IP1]ELP86505.1 hypothetical protein EIN_034160 [Entamoeba invadens IP1]|eukprot:XP_004185851.1 hypothetical protein EIN_034160 [Entamoeba invadens IP1]